VTLPGNCTVGSLMSEHRQLAARVRQQNWCLAFSGCCWCCSQLISRDENFRHAWL